MDRLVENVARIAAWETGGNLRPGQTVEVLIRGVAVQREGGAVTPFFRCGHCHQLAMHIYLTDLISCRKCARVDGKPIDYRCRRGPERSMPDPAQIRKLRERLGAPGLAPLSDLPARKRWSHRRKYLRQVLAIAEREAKFVERFSLMVRRLESADYERLTRALFESPHS